MQCCVNNYGFLAQPSSQAEHDLIMDRLQMCKYLTLYQINFIFDNCHLVDGNYTNSYWLGGVDYFQEGTWQWASGEPWGYETWHEGEPNNVDNEDCLSMSGQDGYNWMDLQCGTR